MNQCLECGKPINGRSDKKFCDDACRNTYNNKLNKDSTNLMRTINYTLRKNYRILSDLKFVDGKVKISKKRLTEEGFNFDYFTHFKTYKNGAEYKFVYGIGYKTLEDDWLLVVDNNEKTTS